MKEYDVSIFPDAPTQEKLDLSDFPDGKVEYDLSWIPSASKVEPVFSHKAQAVKMAKEAGKASLRGAEGAFRGIGAVLEWMGESYQEMSKKKRVGPFVNPAWQRSLEKKLGEKFADWGSDAYDYWGKAMQTGIEAPDPEIFKGSFLENPSWTRAISTVAQAIPSLGMATAITFATKNPLVGAGALGLLEGSEQYIEAREKGKSVKRSSLFGGLSTVGETVLEVLPLTRFLRGGSKKLGKDIFIGAVQEGSEEVLQALWENLIAKLGYDKTRDLTQGMVEGLIAGAGSGGLMGGLTSGRGIQTDSLMEEAKKKGVTDKQLNRMQTAVKEQIVHNAKEIDKELDKSAKKINQPTEVKDVTPDIEQQERENEPNNFMDTLGYFLGDQKGSVIIPDVPIQNNINKFKEALGKEFIRYYGLAPEARQAFVKLTDSTEIRQDDIIDFLKKNVTLNDADAKLLTYHLENPTKHKIPDNIKPQVDIINRTFDFIYSELNKRDLLSKKFPQSMIDHTLQEIKDEKEHIKTLKNEKAIKRHEAKIKELGDKVTILEKLRYVPHKYKPLMESQVINLFREGMVSSKLVSRVSKIIGRKHINLDVAKEAGLIPEEDIRVLLGSYMDYTLKKIAIHDFIESLKANRNIVMSENEAPKEWKKVLLSQLDGFKVHPYLARALQQYAIMPTEKGLIFKGYDTVNRLAKTILFYNPFIMSINDASQSYLAGSVNTKFLKNAWSAVKDFTEKTDFYRDCIKRGLFSAPYNIRPSIEEQIQGYLEETRNQNFWFTRLVKTAVNPIRLYKTIQNFTWSMDRVWRLTNVKYFMQKGLSLQDAINRTTLFLVDYSFIPDHLRTGLNRIFLTPTYRSQMFRLYSNLTKHPIQNKDAVARLIAFHIAWSLIATWAGYKRENFYRFVKKLPKPVLKKDGTELSEQVIVGAGPLFEYHKIFGRAFSRTLYLNLARVPYLAMSLRNNRDWKGDPIFDEALPLPDKAEQILWYLLKTYFAPIEGWDRLRSEDQSALEKVANLLAIPVYKRQPSIKYFRSKLYRIQGDLKNYHRRHPNATPEEIQKVYNEAQKRVDDVMKKIEEYESQ